MNSTEFLKCKKPGGSTLEAVNLAMVHLCNDAEHRPNDQVAEGLTYEELVGTLLQVYHELYYDENETNNQHEAGIRSRT